MLRRAVRTVREYFWFYLALLYFGLSGALYTLIASVLYLLLPRRVGVRVGRRIIGWLFRGFLNFLEFSGLARLDLIALQRLRGEPGLIIAPNHPCLLDAVLVIAQVPEVGCIMKAEIQDNIVLGGGARLAGYIRNDSGLSMVRGAAQKVREGEPLLVFPEGTRTRRAPINAFKGAFAVIAKHTGADIQTVFIETDSLYLRKGWPLLKKPAFPLQYRVRLGRRYTVEGDVTHFMRELEHYYREELAHRVAASVPAVKQPAKSTHPGQPA